MRSADDTETTPDGEAIDRALDEGYPPGGKLDFLRGMLRDFPALSLETSVRLAPGAWGLDGSTGTLTVAPDLYLDLYPLRDPGPIPQPRPQRKRGAHE